MQINQVMTYAYGCIDLRVIFQSARRIKSFFPCKGMINRSQMSKVVYKASLANMKMGRQRWPEMLVILGRSGTKYVAMVTKLKL